MTAEYIAVQVDQENNADEWWAALDATYPGFANSLRRNGVAVIARPLWDTLASLPGFDGGPEYAQTALIDCGDGGDQWADVVARRHGCFDELT